MLVLPLKSSERGFNERAPGAGVCPSVGRSQWAGTSLLMRNLQGRLGWLLRL